MSKRQRFCRSLVAPALEWRRSHSDERAMAVTEPRPPAPIPRFWSTTSRVRIRTLVLLRWLAIVGQTIAVLFVRFGLNVDFPLDWALAAIGVSVVVNLFLQRRSQELAR